MSLHAVLQDLPLIKPCKGPTPWDGSRWPLSPLLGPLPIPNPLVLFLGSLITELAIKKGSTCSVVLIILLLRVFSRDINEVPWPLELPGVSWSRLSLNSHPNVASVVFTYSLVRFPIRVFVHSLCGTSLSNQPSLGCLPKRLRKCWLLQHVGNVRSLGINLRLC